MELVARHEPAAMSVWQIVLGIYLGGVVIDTLAALDELRRDEGRLTDAINHVTGPLPRGTQITICIVGIVICAFGWPYFYGKAALQRIRGRLE